MNSKIKLTFLGTGTSQGIPVIGCTHPVCLSENPKDKRLRVSAMIEWDDYRYIIDCGPDFRYQMLREGITKINGILFTHEHADHTAGLDDIRPFFFMNGDIPLYAHPRVFDSLHQRFDYIFKTENKYPGAPDVEEVEIDKDHSFKLGNTMVTAIEADHFLTKVLGFRIGDLTYLTDVKSISEEEKLKIKNSKVLVINALRYEKHNSHLNLEEALALIEELKPERAYLTHISHLLGFHDETQAKLPENVYLAYDGLEISI